MKKKVTAGLLSLLFALLLVPAALAESATAETTVTSTDAQRTVRIGYIDYSGFISPADDGSFTGYGVDYLDAIANLTGWKYEFVYGSFSDHLAALKDGSIDFLCHCQRTAAREQDYLFSKLSIGAESSVLYVAMDNTDYYYNDYTAFEGMRIGFLAGSFQNGEFADYAAENDFSYQSSEYATGADAFAALDAGEVDAVAMGSLAYQSGYKPVCRFGSDPFYFMTGKQNKDLVRQLDSALGEIQAETPSFTQDLREKYYGTSTATASLTLTREEAEYVDEKKTIIVGLMNNRRPISYQNTDGEAAGIIVDALNKISASTGLTIHYVYLAPGQTGYDFLTSSGGDMVAGVSSSAFSHINPALTTTNSLLDTNVVFVGKSGTDFNVDSDLVVALPTGFINGRDVVAAQYPNFRYLDCTTNEDCLNAIQSGRANVMLQNMYVIRQSLQNPRYSDLEIFPAYSFDETVRAVALPENRTLINVINKGLSLLTSNEKSDIIIANTIAVPYKASLADVLYEYRLPLLLLAILLCLVILMLMHDLASRKRNLVVLEQKNQQLADAVAQAQRASIAKSSFLSRMSHEIRTPMNAIVGLTAIARASSADSEKITSCLAKIDSSSRVLLSILNDVLDMSAIENEKLKISNEEFSLADTLAGISSIYYTQCRNKDVRFQLTVDVVDEHLIGDALHLNQILLNLVSNAYKFTPSGGSISVSAAEKERKGSTAYIRFCVADTGIGMSREMQARLFRPFEQENAGISQKYGGSGLGLSIAKSLVDLMHGAIAVESEPDKGTTFTVDIPFQCAVSNEIGAGADAALESLKVLVLDDDAQALNYTALILERLHTAHVCVSTGPQALEEIAKAEAANQPFDVCLIDWKMPDMNGLEVTRRIRKTAGHKSAVVIVSGYDYAEVEDEARAAGADHFLAKPLFQSTLYNALIQVAHSRHFEASAKGTSPSSQAGSEPAAKPNETPAPEETFAESSSPGTATPDSYDFTGHRVLLVEDNELNTEIATDFLEMVNLEVDHAENGERAVEIFTNSDPGTYDVIMMDIQMPVMDGYEATRIIRASNHPQASTIPILATTANAFREDVSASLNAGMNGHISKPIDTKLLYKELYHYIFGSTGKK